MAATGNKQKKFTRVYRQNLSQGRDYYMRSMPTKRKCK